MKPPIENKKNPTNNPTITNPRRRRRRSHSRKTLSNCLINFAEARREVAKALRRHRSTTTTTNSQYESRVGRGISGPGLPSTEESCCYPLIKAHGQGVAGPTWSTTGPSVVSGPTSILEALEFDWLISDHDESSFAASYSWWVGFLESLDGKNSQQECEFEKPNLDDGPGFLGQAHSVSYDGGEASCSSSSSIDALEIPDLSIDDAKDEMLVYDVLNIS